MNVNKSRGMIIALSFLSLFVSFWIPNSLAALLLIGACLGTAIFILYRHLGELSGISEDNPKMRTLKDVTIFNAGILVLCILFAALLGTGVWKLPQNGEQYFAAAILSIIILFTGNIAPKLPFNRHTGLRLPWTVADEDTWIVAHRILGYLSIPLALLYFAGIAAMRNFEALSFAVVILWVGIPGILSFVFYRKKHHG